VRLLGQTGRADVDEPGTPLKAVKIPTPPVLPKPDTRVHARNDGPSEPTKNARAKGASQEIMPFDELREKIQERQSRVDAAANRVEAGRTGTSAQKTGARRKPAGAEGGIEGALERMRQNIRPASVATEGGDSSNWDD